jgi:hypothetical protein
VPIRTRSCLPFPVQVRWSRFGPRTKTCLLLRRRSPLSHSAGMRSAGSPTGASRAGLSPGAQSHEVPASRSLIGPGYPSSYEVPWQTIDLGGVHGMECQAQGAPVPTTYRRRHRHLPCPAGGLITTGDDGASTVKRGQSGVVGVDPADDGRSARTTSDPEFRANETRWRTGAGRWWMAEMAPNAHGAVFHVKHSP